MTPIDVQGVLERARDQRVMVIGDFFLDRYWWLDRSQDEPSIETGLTAYQIARKTVAPGAAGTVTNNLVALGVKVVAVGFCGEDGEGFELRRCLADLGVDTRSFTVRSDRMTPTYSKPMSMSAAGSEELNRLDQKNRTRTPNSLEDAIIASLRERAGDVSAIIVMDQVSEHDCGVVTERVRDAIGQVGRERPDLPIIADSRARIQSFRDVMLKPNHHEALAAAGMADSDDPAMIRQAASWLRETTGRPAFVTQGPKGTHVADGRDVSQVPALRVEGPIDIVGAGDSATAGIVTALVGGASRVDAALIGNVVASITIQQIGTTGTASPAQVIERYERFRSGDFQ